MQQLKTQLAYAEDVYRRQKNLWDQGIGTEIQLKTAENNVNNLKRPDKYNYRGMGDDQCSFRSNRVCGNNEFKSGRNVGQHCTTADRNC